MLRFFRHIRKSLMEQNKMRTYILYAIGEILLVVIGILIALQVNNWNEERKIQQLSEATLMSLEVELHEAKADIQESINFNQDLVERSERYTAGKFSIDSLQSRPREVFSFTNYLPFNPSLPILERELTSDKLIQNEEELNAQLREIKDLTEQVKSSYFYLDEFWNSQIAPYFIRKQVSVYFDEEIRKQDPERTLLAVQQVFNDEEYRNLSAMSRLFNEAATNSAEYLVEAIDQTLMMIKELK